MNRRHKIYLAIRAIPKTIRFNFHYLPLKQAVKIPVIVSHRVALQQMGGSIKFESPVRTNMVRMGFHENRSFDQEKERAVWNNEGTVVFKGTAYLGNGTRVANTGTLTLGNNFQVSGNSSIICRHETTFGNDVLIAWDCMFMDGDGHRLYADKGGYSSMPTVPSISGIMCGLALSVWSRKERQFLRVA